MVYISCLLTCLSFSACAGPSSQRGLFLVCSESSVFPSQWLSWTQRSGSGAKARGGGGGGAVPGFSCPEACGIFPHQGSNQRPLHWQADSYPPWTPSPCLYSACSTLSSTSDSSSSFGPLPSCLSKNTSLDCAFAKLTLLAVPRQVVSRSTSYRPCDFPPPRIIHFFVPQFANL